MSERRDWLQARDGWYVVLVMDRIGVPLVEALAKTAVTPNQVTLTAMAIRWVAIWLIWIDQPWWAILLWQISFLLDCMDGQLARLTKRTSPLGKILDQWGDIVLTFALLVSISLKALWPDEKATIVALFVWFVLWIVNWLLGEREIVKPAKTQTGDSLFARYNLWTEQHRLKLLPITGIEEYTLVIPIGFGLGWLPAIMPFLLLYRMLALGLRLYRLRRTH